MNSPSRLSVRLLGPPDIRIDDIPIDTDTRKAVALLAYLTQRDTPVPREHLVELMWPDSDPDRGRGALRRTISSLRTALGGRWVETSQDRVGLDGTDMWLDTAVAAEGAAGALDAIGGRFLEGFWIRDAPLFDDWQMATAEHYDRLTRRLLHREIDAAMLRGEMQAAVTLGERLVGLDPIDEAGHRALMSAYAAAGDRAGATRQFRRCVAVLDAELGIGPLPETVELHESILSGRSVRRAPNTARSTPMPIGGLLPLLERADEIETLRLMASEPGVVAVSGPAGSGRTRLISEALPDAIRVGVQAGESELPHALTRNILDAGLRFGQPEALGESAGPAGRIHPGVVPPATAAPSLEGELGPLMLLASIAAALRDLVGDRVLVVDDFDQADPASAEALGYVAGRASDLGLRLVLVTDREHPRRLRLGPLSHSTVAGIALDKGIDPEALMDITGGLPGAVAEVAGDSTPGVALERLRARVVESLDPTDLQVLEGLVVLATATASQVSAVTGRPQEEVVGALDRLISAGLVVDGQTLAATGWAPEVVLKGIGPGRLALLHSRAADALNTRKDPETLAARALHLSRAGRRDEAALAHADAGASAARIHAHESARTHLNAALAAGHSEPGWVYRTLGDVERASGRYDQAIFAYHAAAAYGTDTELERRIGDVYRRWGRLTLADAALASAEAIADQSEIPLILADRAELAYRLGDHESASDLISRAIEMAAGDKTMLARVRNVAGLVRGDPVELEAAISAARQAGLREDEAAALNNLALIRLGDGRPELALDHAGRALALLSQAGDKHRRAAVHGNLADIHHALGNQIESRSHLTLAAELFAEVGVEDGSWDPEIWKLTSW